MAAGAYRDGTRVAGSDAALWAGIFRANRVPVLEAIGSFRETLAGLESALEADDAAGIIRWWERAKSRRAYFESLNGPRSRATVDDTP